MLRFVVLVDLVTILPTMITFVMKNYPANSGSDEPSQGIEVCAGDRGMDGASRREKGTRNLRRGREREGGERERARA